MSIVWRFSKAFSVRGLVLVLTATLGGYCTFGWRNFPHPADDSALAESAYRSAWAGNLWGPNGSIFLFEAAVRANPASPYRWADLGEGLLEAGQTDRASRAMERAVQLGPKLPQILLRAANFEFRVGAEEAGARYAARVLALTRNYDAAVFGAYNRFEIKADTVLKEGLPQDGNAIAAYFRSVLASGSAVDAAAVWARLGAKASPDPQVAAEYVAFLVSRQSFDEAANVWRQQIASIDPSYRRSNLLSNGDFGRPPSGSPLDWSIAAAPGVQVVREPCKEGTNCIKIQFLDAGNVAYHHVRQMAVVAPGSYEFTARGRAADISSDSGVGFRIVDSQDPHRLDLRTAQLRGSTDWVRLEIPVKVPAGTKALNVEIFRPESQAFDNRIRGAVWFTGVTLSRQSSH